MNQLLKVGSTLQTAATPCRVERFLGGGGQGEVYQVDIDNRALALKWYFPHAATSDQQQLLQALVNRGAPDARFLWPIAVVTVADRDGFGYLMPLREARYRSIVDLMKRRVEPSFRALATAGFQLADSFLQVHAKGLCYRDISWGNVFFDPDSGDVRICDNDNVGADGQSAAGVLGTPRFMAPEVVRGDAVPSTASDLHSLAVLLFYLFMIHHPLEGKNESAIHSLDLPAMNKLHGTAPLFIYDPADATNRPVPGLHDNAIEFWGVYPRFLQDLFTKVFTDGLHDPLHGRVRESEWRGAMVRLRDAIFYCAHCEVENFYDAERPETQPGYQGACWSCRRDLRLPPRLQAGRAVIMLNHDTRLFPHHTDPQRCYDFSAPVAEVTRHPASHDRWGLKNLSTDRWVITTTEGTVRDVEPGRSVSLTAGTRVSFGHSEAEIRG